jgi:nucleotide-binding universal stress UspA family protein
VTGSVLVPFDGSPLSTEALEHALTQFPDASITVLHVVDLFEPGYGTGGEYESAYEPAMGSDEWYERADRVSDQLFEQARETAAEHDAELDTESDIGDPKTVIVDYTETEDVDHVVLGAHGRPAERRPVFGAVAETVARRATVPVTLVR